MCVVDTFSLNNLNTLVPCQAKLKASSFKVHFRKNKIKCIVPARVTSRGACLACALWLWLIYGAVNELKPFWFKGAPLLLHLEHNVYQAVLREAQKLRPRVNGVREWEGLHGHRLPIARELLLA